MRLGDWLAFQSTKQACAMLVSAGIDPWKPGLGLDFHPGTCGARPKFGLLACTPFLNRTGYFNWLVEADVTDRARRAELATWVVGTTGSNWLRHPILI